MLTDAQKQTVKAAILADQALAAQPMNSDGAFAIADALNQLATPAFIVWRTSLSLSECTRATGFDWTEVDGLTVGKARIWEWLFKNEAQACDPSRANVRAGIQNCWSGTANRAAVNTALQAVMKRSATRAEKLLATGTGSDTTPATMGFEGPISYQDVQDARVS